MLRMDVLPSRVTVTVRPAMVNWAVEAVDDVFAFTASVTIPGPVTEDPMATVTQVEGLFAVHGHPAGAITATVGLPPAAGTIKLVGDTGIEVQSGRAWSTLNEFRTSPAGLVNLTVPVRAAPLFARTCKEIAPAPVPETVKSMTIQLLPLAAFQD
jgi:hypothetical protein